jgi:hypothetical protein
MRYSGVVGLMALGLLASLAPAGIGAPPLAISPGTTWTYRHVAARPPAPAEAGTATAVYGLVTHQGRSLHYIDITYELIPGLKERVYFEWTGTRLRHVGRVTADDANRVVETVYDRPLDPGVRAEGSGTTVITEGGVQRAVLSVRYAILGGAHGVRGIVLDKSNEPYVFLETHGLSHGISWTQYTVLNLRSLSPVFLYDGGQDGEGGGCNRHEFLDLKRATLKVSAGLRDRDQDGYTDIVIEAEEQDCKTNAVVQVIKVFFARADGFKASP